MGTKKKTIKSWVYLKDWNPVTWEWWCFPFLNVKMSGTCKTIGGARVAACRTIKRLGFEADVVLLKPKRYDTDSIRRRK